MVMKLVIKLTVFPKKENKDTCAIKGLCDDHIARSSAKIDGLTAKLTPEQTDLKKLRYRINAITY